jgi:hypothetical protein
MLQWWEDFVGWQLRFHHIFHVHQFAFLQRGIEIESTSLEKAFGFQRVVVQKTLRNRLEPFMPRDRHSVLPDDSEAEADILAWIQHRAEKSKLSMRTGQTFSIIVTVNSARPSLADEWIHSYYNRETIWWRWSANLKRRCMCKYLKSFYSEQSSGWKKRFRVLFATWSLIWTMDEVGVSE